MTPIYPSNLFTKALPPTNGEVRSISQGEDRTVSSSYSHRDRVIELGDFSRVSITHLFDSLSLTFFSPQLSEVVGR